MYTQKIKTPIYEPKGKLPEIDELVDTSRFEKLSQEIGKSNIDPKLKLFLRRAATRHYNFDYVKIAEFYAQASPEVQKLMEQSALVIIDFDSAIENGFVMMNKKLMEIRKNEPEA